MKQSALLFGFALAVAVLTAAVGITSVKMEDYQGSVCRVVIGLNGEAEYRITDSDGAMELRLEDFDRQSKARIEYNSSELVSAIEQQDEVLRIAVSSPFRYETMLFEYPRRLAIDVFRKNPNRKQRLAMADFYAETGKLNSADKAFNSLHIDYRKDAQILYHWALLLAKRGSERLAEKVALIPTDSPYYARAQKLLGTSSPEEPPPPPPVEAKPVAPAAPAVRDTVKVEPVKPQPAPVPVAKTEKVPLCGSPWYQIPLLLVLAALLVVVLVLLFGKKKSKPKTFEMDAVEEGELGLDTATLCKMVSKLLDDGWTNREIASELKIKPRQVEHLVHLLHSGQEGHEGR